MENRYQKHINLTGFDAKRQEAIAKASVLIVGIGGLGCAVVQALAGYGIGRMGLVDADVIQLSNLHRQWIYSEADIGCAKVDKARQYIHGHNSEITVDTFAVFLHQKNVSAILMDYDIIVDCTDNFLCRYILSDACVLLKKPLVHGAIFQYEGLVTVLNSTKEKFNYRDIYPSCPNQDSIVSCNAVGAYAITTNIIGLMQANEIIRCVTNFSPLKGDTLLYYNAKNNSTYTIAMQKSKSVQYTMPTSLTELEAYPYEQFCGTIVCAQDEINAKQFDDFLQVPSVQIIDVRNEDELPRINSANSMCIPMSKLHMEVGRLNPSLKMILFCHQGVRSAIALDILQEEYNFTDVCHLKGGIVQWLHYMNKQET